jgi:hypothetical protein
MGAFYPGRLDIFNEADGLARMLGGKLEVPPISWKYRWIKAIFGLDLAKRAQIFFPRLRWSVVRLWDKLAFRLENGKIAGHL